MVMLQGRTCGGNASAERIVGENECRALHLLSKTRSLSLTTRKGPVGFLPMGIYLLASGTIFDISVRVADFLFLNMWLRYFAE